MKILMATPMPPQPQATGAIPLVLHAELTALRRHHEVTLLTVAGRADGERQAVERLRQSGLEVHAVPRSEPGGPERWRRRRRLVTSWAAGQLPWRTVYFWEPGLQRALDRLLAERHFDLVTAEDNAMGVYRYRTTAPLLLTEHEVRRPRPFRFPRRSDEYGVRWQIVRGLLAELDWQRWPRYQRRIWGRFDRIQVFTERDAEAVRLIAPGLAERVRVNPFAVDLPSPCDPRLEQPGALLFVGNFTHPPNVDAARTLVQEIMPLLRGRVRNARLVIAGIHPPASLTALAGHDVSVTGFVPDLDPLLERVAVVVAPIRTGGGMRMKVLHSMAKGKAVVTTPRGAEGLTALTPDPPVLIAESNQALADAIVRLLEHEEARHELGRRARSFVAASFGPEAYARRLEAVYAELAPVRRPERNLNDSHPYAYAGGPPERP
jgi:glycosyltransferase involved in cell wall biosynthesis